jgi:hypothetical protein
LEKIGELFNDEVVTILESEEQVITNEQQVIGEKKAEVDGIVSR